MKPKKAPKPLDYSRIITVFNQKGGCGKTSVSMQLGGTLALRGYKVIVVDMDKQGTATQWSARGKDNPFPATVASLAAQEEHLVGEIEKFAQVYDFVVIDCPPAIESQTPWAALQISDLGLIPIAPVMDNLWASEMPIELGWRAQQENPDLLLRFVVSRMKRGNLYESCLKKLKGDSPIPTLDSMLFDRNAYPESQLIGQTVHRRGNRSAINELESMTDEVLEVLGIGVKKGAKK